MKDFQTLLDAAVAQHGHLCAGQILGVRLAMRGLAELDIDPERDHKRVIVYVEIDRCAADAVAAVTGCSLGKRTLKYADYGKMAATFVDTKTGRAVRIVALDSAREHAWKYAPEGSPKNVAQMAAYRVMPDAELFNVQAVRVNIPEFDKPGHPISRVVCAECGEGVNDGREVVCNGKTMCRACASNAYYVPVDQFAFAVV